MDEQVAMCVLRERKQKAFVGYILIIYILDIWRVNTNQIRVIILDEEMAAR
ncbi:hypothetical protein AB4516_10805 [Vibrio sp. 10N.222.54.F12]|uniref:hypothetical protein n=1 Tax=Vibrio TaxID=662 RepID=UPI0012FFF086|nr:hypothetical protein [Vibrio tasmaniensis]